MEFSKNVLTIDAALETGRLVHFLKHNTHQVMRRQGGVLGISGGVDSSVVLALCVRAFGPEHLIAVIMPERESDPESEKLAKFVAEHFGISPVVENITSALEGFGCYTRRDQAIRNVFPEFDADAGYKSKIVLPHNLLDQDSLNIYSLTIITPEGEEKIRRLPLREYRQIVAASNFKQRARMSMLYHHAELRNYAVIGTENRNEHDQGFFVKYGDGGADIKPIVHFYKTQIYQLADFLDVPEIIRKRTPTSDTYSARSSQEEFFFQVPFETMDLLWYAKKNNVPISEVEHIMGLTEVQIRRAYNDLAQKSRATTYLRTHPLHFRDNIEYE